MLTCYSPVRHFPSSCPDFTFDLHVLSTPPAFVLSQDQTLQFKSFSTGFTRLIALLKTSSLACCFAIQFSKIVRILIRSPLALSPRASRLFTQSTADCQYLFLPLLHFPSRLWRPLRRRQSSLPPPHCQSFFFPLFPHHLSLFSYVCF